MILQISTSARTTPSVEMAIARTRTARIAVNVIKATPTHQTIWANVLVCIYIDLLDDKAHEVQTSCVIVFCVLLSCSCGYVSTYFVFFRINIFCLFSYQQHLWVFSYRHDTKQNLGFHCYYLVSTLVYRLPGQLIKNIDSFSCQEDTGMVCRPSWILAILLTG